MKETHAAADAELTVRHEVRPFIDLLPIAVHIAEDLATDWIPFSGCAMRIELPSFVALLDVDLREVADTSDLDVVRRLHEVNALQRAVGHDARSVAGRRAVRHDHRLRLSDGRRRLRRVETEVIDAVQPDGARVGVRLVRRALFRGSTVCEG